MVQVTQLGDQKFPLSTRWKLAVPRSQVAKVGGSAGPKQKNLGDFANDPELGGSATPRGSRGGGAFRRRGDKAGRGSRPRAPHSHLPGGASAPGRLRNRAAAPPSTRGLSLFPLCENLTAPSHPQPKYLARLLPAGLTPGEWQRPEVGRPGLRADARAQVEGRPRGRRACQEPPCGGPPPPPFPPAHLSGSAARRRVRQGLKALAPSPRLPHPWKVPEMTSQPDN